jgi:hypothetical protein
MREHDTVAGPHLAHQILPAHLFYSTLWEPVSARHLKLAIQKIIGDLKILISIVGLLMRVESLKGGGRKLGSG